jgi:UDP-glucuronate 4-epimerase
MRILVTGTAGFIGFHLTRRLLAEGHEVVGVDNFNDYYSVQLKQDRSRLLESDPAFRVERMDLTEGDRLLALMRDFQPDVVCNLAAQAGVRYSLTNPHAYQKSNLEGFLNVLEACRHTESKPRLVYASSSSVYGGNTKLPFSESDPVDTPVNLFGVQTIGLRFFTVYGPWGRPDMALWLFTEAMLAGKPIKVFNHGQMQRDFTYVDDVVQGICASMFSPELEPYEIFNLGNHRSEKLMDMIQVLAESLGVEPKMELLPMQPGDVPATYADVAKARAKLGFEPTTPIAKGIPAFTDWYREYHGL